MNKVEGNSVNDSTMTVESNDRFHEIHFNQSCTPQTQSWPNLQTEFLFNCLVNK